MKPHLFLYSVHMLRGRRIETWACRCAVAYGSGQTIESAYDAWARKINGARMA